jgi:hypothetical protein
VKAASRSEAELLKLGGVREMVQRKDGLQPRIIFGRVGETRFIFMPEGSAWKVALDVAVEGTQLLEELKRELNKSRRNLWNADKKKPDIAFQAVHALLTCSRDCQDFLALPKSKHKKAGVYPVMINAHLTILTTLQALKRDVKNESRKLQVAFEWLDDHQWPSQIEKLRHHALMLARDLQRPPSKKELKDRFDPRLPPYQVRASEFSTLLKAAGLSWLKRGKRGWSLVPLR